MLRGVEETITHAGASTSGLAQALAEREIDARTIASFTPYADWVLVKLDELPKMTAGGLHRPDRIADWTAYGRVLAVGPGKLNERGVRIPTDLNAGERVVFDWRPSHEEGTVRRLFGPRTLLLRADEIAGVVED
jgi:chaperonin GroES